MNNYQLDLGSTVILGSAWDYLTFLKGCEETVIECAYMEWYKYQDILAEERDRVEMLQLNDADAAHWTDKDWSEYFGDNQADSQINIQKDSYEG